MTDFEPTTPPTPPASPTPPPTTRLPTANRPGGNSYVYMLPFAFSCVILTLVPLVGEFLATIGGGRGMNFDFSALRPLALLTGAGFAFALLLRGLAPDYQILTLVGLLVGLCTALLENMLAGQTLMFGGLQLQHSLRTMSTFVQATFLSAAAAAAWLAPTDNPDESPPPRFLSACLSALALVHFLLPCDMVLQSVFHHWGSSPLPQAAVHERIRVALWCLVAAWLVFHALKLLRHSDDIPVADSSTNRSDRHTPE